MLYYRLLLDYYCVHHIKDDCNENGSKYYLSSYDSSEENAKCLKQYLAMMDVSTAYYRWLFNYLKGIHSMKAKPSHEELLNLIKKIDNSIEGHNIPESINELVYTKLQRNRYLFWRLDYYLFEQRNEVFREYYEKDSLVTRIVEHYEFKKNRSIEHLHPQDESNNDSWNEENLHKFGNLAMISVSFNSEQGNDPVDVKFARIGEQVKRNGLQSLKLYLMYLEAGKNPNSWNENLATKHGEEMYKLLQETR